MKKTIFIALAALVAAATLATSACKKDDDNSNNPVSTVLPAGQWKITWFQEDANDETHYFAGFVFDFQGSGNVSATDGSKTVGGTWADGNDDSKSKLILDFENTLHFDELDEDWEILSRTDSKIELRHVSGGNGGIDFLTFEKV